MMFYNRVPVEALLKISDYNGIYITRLAKKIRTSESNIYLIIKKLEKAGYILTTKRVRRKGNILRKRAGKERYIYLTHKGRELALLFLKIKEVLYGTAI